MANNPSSQFPVYPQRGTDAGGEAVLLGAERDPTTALVAAVITLTADMKFAVLEIRQLLTQQVRELASIREALKDLQ